MVGFNGTGREATSTGAYGDAADTKAAPTAYGGNDPGTASYSAALGTASNAGVRNSFDTDNPFAGSNNSISH